MHHFAWLTPTHTLIHLDGIALGSLLALGLYTLHLSRRAWLLAWLSGVWFSASSRRQPSPAAPHSSIRRSHSAFGGAVLAMPIASDRLAARAIRSTPAPPRTARFLRPHQLRPLHDSHHGVHLFRMVRPEDGPIRHGRQPGDRRLSGSLRPTACATALWYGFESQILKFKRFF